MGGAGALDLQFRWIGPSAFLKHGLRHGFEAPNQSGPSEELEAVVSGVDFPPVETVAGRALIAVVVIVPTFAETDYREDETIAGIIVGFEAPFAHEMGHRVDARRAMEQRRCADKEAPDKKLWTRHAEAGSPSFQASAKPVDPQGEYKGHDKVEAVKKDQFGILGQVLDLGVVGRKIAFAGDPTDMRPKKTMHDGRVCIVLVVAMAVMVAMVTGPP